MEPDPLIGLLAEICNTLTNIEEHMAQRSPLAILREIDSITAETRLTDAYKTFRIKALNEELANAQALIPGAETHPPAPPKETPRK